MNFGTETSRLSPLRHRHCENLRKSEDLLRNLDSSAGSSQSSDVVVLSGAVRGSVLVHVIGSIFMLAALMYRLRGASMTTSHHFYHICGEHGDPRYR